MLKVRGNEALLNLIKWAEENILHLVENRQKRCSKERSMLKKGRHLKWEINIYIVSMLLITLRFTQISN